MKDAAIKARIETTYAFNDSVDTTDIVTNVENGIVTLEGAVAEHDLAVKASSRDEQAEGFLWANTKATASDEWTEKRVEVALGLSKHVELIDLDVEVKEDICTLTGTAEDAAEKERAAQIAGNTRGVESVVNNIHVVGSSQ